MIRSWPETWAFHQDYWVGFSVSVQNPLCHYGCMNSESFWLPRTSRLDGVSALGRTRQELPGLKPCCPFALGMLSPHRGRWGWRHRGRHKPQHCTVRVEYALCCQVCNTICGNRGGHVPWSSFLGAQGGRRISYRWNTENEGSHCSRGMAAFPQAEHLSTQEHMPYFTGFMIAYPLILHKEGCGTGAVALWERGDLSQICVLSKTAWPLDHSVGMKQLFPPKMITGLGVLVIAGRKRGFLSTRDLSFCFWRTIICHYSVWPAVRHIFRKEHLA